MTDNKLVDIRTLDSSQLVKVVEDLNQPKYRAKQIEEWIWQKGVTAFEQMTSLPKGLRDEMAKTHSFFPPKVDAVQRSDDGTIKVRLSLHDGLSIESVLIPVVRDGRFTVCVSSQAGCSLSCTFCATGKMGLLRQLTAAEIVDQVRIVQEICQETYEKNLTNIVYMGMGEPLLNYKQVSQSIDRLTSEIGMGFSAKRITISTAGIAKMIKKMADDHIRVNLALSLHAANDEKRDKIMPINESNNLNALIEAIKYYYLKTKNRISFEYIALRDVNDSLKDAVELSRLCSHFPVRVNIIEYNPIGDGMYQASEEDRLDIFMKRLKVGGVTATLRRSRGKDIDAACGQLANKG